MKSLPARSRLIQLVALASMAAGITGNALAAEVLTTKFGMTVYTFDKDTAGKSACTGGCLAAWPAVAANDMPGGTDFGVITRDDGIQQATHKGRPLYLYAQDRKPGDMTGDGVQGAWHAVAATSSAKSKPSSGSGGYSGAYPGGYGY